MGFGGCLRLNKSPQLFLLSKSLVSQKMTHGMGACAHGRRLKPASLKPKGYAQRARFVVVNDTPTRWVCCLGLSWYPSRRPSAPVTAVSRASQKSTIFGPSRGVGSNFCEICRPRFFACGWPFFKNTKSSLKCISGL